jgi:hypothetical protein
MSKRFRGNAQSLIFLDIHYKRLICKVTGRLATEFPRRLFLILFEGPKQGSMARDH